MQHKSMEKIKNFSDLEVWKKAHTLDIEIYKVTKPFPKEEMFSLINQMRRASISISSNIAEGFGRSSLKEKAQFYYIASGSLTELQNQLLVSKDVQYLSLEKFDSIFPLTIEIHKMLNGLIKSISI